MGKLIQIETKMLEDENGYMEIVHEDPLMSFFLTKHRILDKNTDVGYALREPNIKDVKVKIMIEEMEEEEKEDV